MAERTCRICDAPITDRSFHPEGWKQRTCSMECLRTHWRLKSQRKDGTKTKADKPCLICGEPTGVSPGRGRDRLYCRACAAPRTASSIEYRWCRDCGALFVTGPRNHRSTRCRPCAGEYRRRRSNSRRPSDTRLRSQARRVLIARVRHLYQHCWICDLPIDLDLDAQRDPLGSCVDEVIPRSRGGSPLDMANVGHAHRICNGKRGDRAASLSLRAECRTVVLSIREARDATTQDQATVQV